MYSRPEAKHKLGMNLCVCVSVEHDWSGLSVCLSGFSLTLCVWKGGGTGVCVSGGRHRQTSSHMLSFFLLICLGCPPFFYFLFPSVTCLSQRPPVRPVLMCALLCFLSRLSAVAVPKWMKNLVEQSPEYLKLKCNWYLSGTKQPDLEVISFHYGELITEPLLKVYSFNCPTLLPGSPVGCYWFGCWNKVWLPVRG